MTDQTTTTGDGLAMPLLGLGVWQAAEGAQATRAVGWALEAGYRHIDTAQLYGNERSVGEGLRASGVPREQVFLTTKFRPGRRDPERELQASLQRLGVDQVDLYLVHWPQGGPTRAWAGMERAAQHGLAKAIGVSNFAADDLDAAVSTMVTTLRPATGRDWSVPAGALEWDCWHTAEHLGDVLLSYAAQLVAQPTKRYVRFMANADKDGSPAEVLEFAEAGGRILAATVRTAPAQVRAYHPTGMADPEGFAGMGCVEALVHGHDIAQGLGLALDPAREVCTRVLARMFPHVVADLADLDPWTALLWTTGRIALPGRPRVAHWRWHGAPPAENR